jgi:hypothetical protein
VKGKQCRWHAPRRFSADETSPPTSNHCLSIPSRVDVMDFSTWGIAYAQDEAIWERWAGLERRSMPPPLVYVDRHFQPIIPNPTFSLLG